MDLERVRREDLGSHQQSSSAESMDSGHGIQALGCAGRSEMPFESDDKHDEGSAPDRAPDRREYCENGTAAVAFAQRGMSLVSLRRQSLRNNSGGRSWRAIQRGFKQLCEEDQQMLRKWFSIPAAASVAQACRILADRAPDIICEDLIYAARNR